MRTLNRVSILGLFFSIISIEVLPQVGIGTSVPADCAILELQSASQGFLLPRMSTFQQKTLENPALGLIVYNLDSNDVYIFNGSFWLALRDLSDTLRLWSCGDFIEDQRDNKEYGTVQIGDQCWMAENLNIGSRINGIQNQTEYGAIEKYCYNDNEANCEIYGGLYQWNEMMQYESVSGSTGICPDGWHLPTDEEWAELTIYLGGDMIAGGKMKSTGTINEGTGLWQIPNEGANNESSFMALPGGYRNHNDGGFYEVSARSYIWTSSEFNTSGSWVRVLSYDDVGIVRYEGSKPEGSSVRCIMGEATVSLPTVISSDISEISITTAVCGGNVIADGGAEVTARGVCWNTSSEPTTDDSHTSDGNGIGNFISNITGLNPNTFYYVRAYATNSQGTAYGEEQTFTTLPDDPNGLPCPGTPTVTYFNQIYNTFQIGSQCWLKENLNAGIRINGIQEQSENGTIEKYCYDDIDANCFIYGGLYQWDEMMQYITISGSQGICPDGWHIPTDMEWITLTDYLGRESIAGGKMKSTGTIETGTGLWNEPNSGASNESNFTGFPGGYRYSNNGNFQDLGTNAFLWTSSEYNSGGGWMRGLNYNEANASRYNGSKPAGLSVRCIKGEATFTPPILTTSNISDISQTTAACGGSVTYDGCAAVSARGVCWNTFSNPTTADSHTSDGTGTGDFSSSLTGLTAGTLYYVRAYATNSQGTGYGEERIFTTLSDGNPGEPCPGLPNLIYFDQVYNTVQIGSQCWLKEYLNVGSRINGTQNQTDNSSIEKYCYNNDDANCMIYGGLYQWDEMMQYITTPGTQGICPEGWHIPSDIEWNIITSYLGGEYAAGGKMKSIGTIIEGTGLWQYPNEGATNESGFTAIPGGSRSDAGSFLQISDYAYIWTSTLDADHPGDVAWSRRLDYINPNCGPNNAYNTTGFSVRCLKD